MGRVEGKVALITGAGRGMGASHAEMLAHEGADVILLDAPPQVATADYAMSTKEDLDRTVAAVEQHDRRAIAVEGDVRSQADLDRAVEQGISEFGKIDFLVANAGIWGQLAPITDMTEEQWQETVDINLTGVWHSVKAVAAHMRDRQEGAIVLISSISGLEGQALSANYSSAKHGVIGLMRSTALELGPHNVRCNAICPGFIDTPIHHWQAAYDLLAGKEGGTAADRDAAARFYGILKGRGPLHPSIVSNAVLFLLSEDSGEITGHELPVDSGHMVLPHFNPAPVD
ncbi:MAG: mycofactocin-coupled SDR family oxidoreductase [Solirubrobacteraceae bacterium]